MAHVRYRKSRPAPRRFRHLIPLQVKGSDWLGDQDAIHYMCREAPHTVIEVRDADLVEVALRSNSSPA